MQSLIVFSHLRWDLPYQRPHQLMTRLARRWQVVFVEEPLAGFDRDELEVFEAAPGLQVWRPHVTGDAAAIQDIVGDEVRTRGITGCWLWFQTPMALPLAAGLQPRGVVYDCMQEHSSIDGAPRERVQRENALFKMADLVFTDGDSTYSAKRSRHPDVHCFPESDDATANAMAELIEQADELAECNAFFAKPLLAAGRPLALTSGHAHPGQRVLARADRRAGGPFVRQ